MKLDEIDKQIVLKISTMENRINLSVNVDIFDRSLIVADLLNIDKDEAFNLILEVRKNE